MTLNKEKMTYLKSKAGLKNKDVAHLTGIPVSTVEKIFAGITKNPTLESLTAIAKVLNCSIDDFCNENLNTAKSYYHNENTAEMAQEIHDNKDLRILFDASRNLKAEDIKAITDIANRLKGNS